MFKSTALTAVLLLPNLALAQTPQASQFEVASVKEAAVGKAGVTGGCHGIDSVYPLSQQAAAPPLGQCVITSARLSHLIGIAYGVAMGDLKSGPDWIERGDLRFDIRAKAEDPKLSEKQLQTMLQNLLAERFQLKSHFETAQISGFALTAPNSGLKLKASQSDQLTMTFRGPQGEALPKPSLGQPISLTARKFSMTALAKLLTQLGTQPVVDKTGLTEEYDFQLSWDENAGPALSTALREQLGLKIDSAKVPVATFVVDSAQKPSAN